MPKLINIISPPRRRGKDYHKYICHPTVLKAMLNNLKKMPYNTFEDKQKFADQLFKIVGVLRKWVNDNGDDMTIYLLYNLFNYLGGTGRFFKGQVYIYDCNSPQARIYYNSYDLNKKNYGTGIVLVPVRLVPNDHTDHHQNILLLDYINGLSWRIEPNNSPRWDHYAKYINPILKSLSKDLGVTFKGNYYGSCPWWVNKLPKKVLQYIPLDKPSNVLPHGGLCMFISIGRYIYGEKLTDEILIKFIVGFVKNEIKKICNS
jgi:hypothetical protein